MNCAYCDKDLGPYPEEDVLDAEELEGIQIVKWTWSEGLGRTRSLYFCDPDCFTNEVSSE